MKRVLICLGALGASLSAVLVRYSTAPSLILVFYRMLISALLSAVVLPRCREELRRLQWRDVLLCAVSGLFLGVHFYSYFEAVQHTAIAQAVVLTHTEVLLVALSSVLLFHNRLSAKAWLAIGVTFAGAAVVAAADAAGGGSLQGDLMAVGAAVCMAVYTLLGAVCRRRLSTGVYTCFTYLASALTVLALALANGLPVFGYDPVNYATAAGMAVFCTLMGHSIFNWGLKYFHPAFISTVRLLDAPISTLWGILLFGEYPGAAVVAGGAVTILGIALYSRASAGAPEGAGT